MNIGIINIEPSINNTAYMQIARYYKSKGHKVEWWSPENHKQFNAVFCSSLFTYTDKSQIPDDVITGGTGYNVKSRLSKVIENSQLDYSIYPLCDTSYIWFSRGCKRQCPWCIVHDKEGDIHPVDPKNLNPAGRTITVCDNSFFENPEWEKSIEFLRDKNLPCDIQGIDVRTITLRQAHSLTKIIRKKHKRFKIAWDNPYDEQAVMKGISLMTRFIPPYDLMCYVLIGRQPSDHDLYRVNKLKSMKINPFVMPLDKNDFYQKTFARWVNHKAIFKSVTWEKYFNRQWKKEEKLLGRDQRL